MLDAIHNMRKEEFRERAEDLKALKKEFGDRVEEIVLEASGKRIEAEWAQIAKEHGRNDIQGIKDTLWKWVQSDGMEYTWQDTNEGTQFKVTKCPIADMAKEINETHWGFVCYCTADPHIAKGFNPSMKFTRTKTLMQGDDCCDHCYCLDDVKKK